MLEDALLLEVVEEVSRKFTRKSYERLLVDLGLFSLSTLKDNDEISGLTKYDLILETLRSVQYQYDIIYGLYKRRLLSKELLPRLIQAGMDFGDEEEAPKQALNARENVKLKLKDNSIIASNKTKPEQEPIVESKGTKPSKKTYSWPQVLALLTSLAVICAIVSGLNDTFALWDRFFSIKTPVPTSNEIDSASIATPLYSSNNIRLIPGGDQNIVVKLSDQSLSPNDVIPLNETVTVIFKILNNGISPVTIRALVIGSRGPGVNCENPNVEKWSAPDIPFPTLRDITIQPGEEYEYQGSRAFYLPGDYFLEPIIQGPNGNWGGVQPFSCFSITVGAAQSSQTQTILTPSSVATSVESVPLVTTSTPEIKYITVEATSFPFQYTGINTNLGDTLEFNVDAGLADTWQCVGDVYLSAEGQLDIEIQKGVFYTPANFCSLVGYIEGEEQGRQYLQIGVSKSIAVEISGMLYLGANDAPPEKCSLQDKQECYTDNDGELTVKIYVIRRN